MRVQPAYRFSGQPRFGANDLDNFGMSTKTKVLLGACLASVAGLVAGPTIWGQVDDWAGISQEERLEKDLAHFQRETDEVQDVRVIKDDPTGLYGGRYQFEGSDGQVYTITKIPGTPGDDRTGRSILEETSEQDGRTVLDRSLSCDVYDSAEFLASGKLGEEYEYGYTEWIEGKTDSPELTEKGCNFLVELYKKVKAKVG